MKNSMIHGEIELLMEIKAHYENLKKFSDVYYQYIAGKRTEFKANRDSFISTFDNLYKAIIALKNLDIGYVDLQPFGKLNSDEVSSLRNIKYSDSVKVEQCNEKQAEAAMQNIVNRLKNHELSSILEKIESLEADN